VGDNSIEVTQETQFPWGGKVRIVLNPMRSDRFDLKVRIPGWAKNTVVESDLYHFTKGLDADISFFVNGKPTNYRASKGYATIKRKWSKGDEVTFVFDMSPRIITAHDSVVSIQDKIAVQSGPFVYAAEWPEVDDGNILSLVFDPNQAMTSEFVPDFLGGVKVVHAEAVSARATLDGGVEYSAPKRVKLIPYFAWNNRGPGEMMVWLPTNEKSMRPLPSPTIASKSTISASTMTPIISAISDQLLPSRSGDHTWPYYHWWPKVDVTEWVKYSFDKEYTISSSKVYWYDDGPFGGCRIPKAWHLEYKRGNQWIPVAAKSDYPVVKDDWSAIEFEPVATTALRLVVQLPEQHSSGIHEWVVR